MPLSPLQPAPNHLKNIHMDGKTLDKTGIFHKIIHIPSIQMVKGCQDERKPKNSNRSGVCLP